MVKETGATKSADRPANERPLDTMDCLAGGGEMGKMTRAIDWSLTPVGPVAGWSQPFRSTVGLVLRNRFPLSLWWGPSLVQFYNDPFRPILGAKHPAALGQSGSECWAEIWPTIGPMIEGPLAGEPATGSEDLALLIHRNGFFEETHFRVAYSPVPDETVPGTGIGGVLATVSETTAQIQSERQFRTLRDLAAAAAGVKSSEEACATAAATLSENLADVPFSLLYLLDEEGPAVLVAASGFGGESVAAPSPAIDIARGQTPLLFRLADAGAPHHVEVVDALEARLGALPTGTWAEPPRSVIILPLAAPGQDRPYGVMIEGISPHRRLDEGYRSFFELSAAQVVTAIRNARAHDEEEKRLEALATLDRAKTTFFSNVSHEFRTPLSLMMGPIEDAMASPEGALKGPSLAMAQRNALRLLKLVNSLLDFSRMEAGRVEASYQLTDLGQLTADLASHFRAAMERGGLRLVVEPASVSAHAFVDREMWEKIVFNLLSNAFKHTFEGEVVVGLAVTGDVISLTVRDTGIGIPQAELPRVFERFHRVRGARTRSHEGSGIGLALVKDLVKLHGGRIEVESRVGAGTCFTVTIPTGSAHLPAERIEAARALASTKVGSAAYVNDAVSWLASDASPPAHASPPVPAASSESGSEVPALPVRILLADDNADMRDYLKRLLSTRWTGEAVADGQQALEAARRERPTLLVADVMMPGLDGLELTSALRADPATRGLPIILLSARSGEEALSEGLATGANDYVVKPFSARELIARVSLQLEQAQAREDDRVNEGIRMAAEQFRQIAEFTTQAKDEFLALLGHELRNPLAPILTALQIMEMRGDQQSLRERAVIERQVRHVVRLADDLLDVSRITRGKVDLDKRAIRIDEVITSAIDSASPLLEQRKRRVLVTVVPRDLTLEADRFRLAQVVSNILINAAKFTDPGGTIVISAELGGDTMILRVKDTGMGIEPALLPRVFEAFAQAGQASDRARGGLGLGLALAKSLITLHGGQVEAHSAGPGMGSEFVIRLPALQGAAAPETARPLTPPIALGYDPPTGLRVLVVDDNEDAAIVLSEALLMKGHEVVVAHNGADALKARLTFEPDVALLDIGLPVMDGYELAGHLRARCGSSELRLIAITGYGEERDRSRSKAAGFNEHLVKPVDLNRVCQLLAASAGSVSTRCTS